MSPRLKLGCFLGGSHRWPCLFFWGAPDRVAIFRGDVQVSFFRFLFFVFFFEPFIHTLEKKSPKQGHSNKIGENLPSLFCSNQIKVADLQLHLSDLCWVGLLHPSNFWGVKEKSKKLVDWYPLKECTLLSTNIAMENPPF